MPAVNPGPAITANQNSQNVLIPQNQGGGTNLNTNPGLANALRLISSVRGMSLAITGDAGLILPIDTASFSVLYVIVTNAQVSGVSGSIATAALGVFTAPNAGGTAIVANATLSTNTASNIVAQRTVASTSAVGQNFAIPQLYVNVGTALANATCDVFVYGFDLS